MIHGGNVWEAGGPADWLDFSANIRPEGPPEWVAEALQRSLDDVRYYPDPDMRRARRGLAEYTGLPEERILPTAGGEAAIDLVLSCGKGTVYTMPVTFGEYTRRAAVHGRRHALWADECEAGDTLILANPDNPSGRSRTKDDLLYLYQKLNKAGAELVVDEAFIDYCPERSLRRYIVPGLTVIGSMTKILGIPGVRLGFICAEPEQIRMLQEKTLPWSLSAQAVEIAAELPVHADGIRKEAEINKTRRVEFAAQLTRLGAEVAPSESNFLLADFHRNMTEPVAALKTRRILVRNCGSFGLPDSFLRLAVRTEAENGRLINALEEILHAR